MARNDQSFGQRAADALTIASGSWPTFWAFTAILFSYIVFNLIPLTRHDHFDPFPFEFLTLVLSLIANYQALIVMISQAGQARAQKRQEERDRVIQQQSYEMIMHQQHIMEGMVMLLEEYKENLVAASIADEEIQDTVDEILEKVNHERGNQ